MAYAARTHMGNKRHVNEDRYIVMAYHVEENRTPALLTIVADGIGGHKAGEVAAQLTVETITQGVATFQGGDPLPCLQSAIIEAGRVVKARVELACPRGHDVLSVARIPVPPLGCVVSVCQ